MRPKNLPRFTAGITYIPGEARAGLTALADALLLMTGDPLLDEALRIAHNFNTVVAQHQTRRRVLEQAAHVLRDQLATIARQIDEAA